MFQFGVPRQNDLVFTRRIGLSPNGRIIPIRAGARLSGRQGPYSIGAMNIQTGEEHGFAADNFTVLRVRRDIESRSSIGALFTNREGGGGFNRVFGADAGFLFKQAWALEGFLAKVDAPDIEEGAHSAYLRFAYDTDRWGADYRYMDAGENFQPGIGFVRRPGSRQNAGELRYSPRPGLEWVRKFDFSASLQYVTDQGNILETRTRELTVGTTFESGDALTLAVVNQLEQIEEPFALRTGVAIQPGVYRFNTFSARLDTFRRRHVRLNLAYDTGGFWNGERDRISADTSYRINRYFDLSGRYEVNWVDLPAGKFTTQLVSTRFQVAFGNDMALLTLFQYNTDSRLFSSNIRFNWIVRPGSDFFIVYNETDEWGGVFNIRNRSLAVKLNYLFAF